MIKHDTLECTQSLLIQRPACPVDGAPRACRAEADLPSSQRLACLDEGWRDELKGWRAELKGRRAELKVWRAELKGWRAEPKLAAGERRLVDQTCVSWNQTVVWLGQLEGLRAGELEKSSQQATR